MLGRGGDKRGGYIMAKGETVATSAALRDAFRWRRCILPASGFYEWQGARAPKQPWLIEHADGSPMGIAGLWEDWRDPATGEIITCCAVIAKDANAAMALVIIAVTWRWAGYNAIIILAGLQSIPGDVYEAATLDKVSKRQQFFYITLPLLKPIILFCVVLSVIGTMQLFAEPFLITNRGGPGGGTETLGLFLYRQGFTSLNFGYASAIAYTMAALAIAISLLNLWVGREPK